jgi:predicted PurR-regulated permease PerM
MPDPQPFQSTISRAFFIICSVFVLYLCYLLLEPFLIPIFLAAIVTVVSLPLYRRILKISNNYKIIASLLTCLLLAVIMLIPILLIAGIMTNQAMSMYTYISELIANNQVEDTMRELLGYVSPLWKTLHNTFGISEEMVVSQLGDILSRTSQFIYTNAMLLVRGFTSLLINFILILFITFYLLMDGRHISLKLMSLSPLPQEINIGIGKDMLITLRTAIKGTFCLALLQGCLDGLGFWIFGVPNSLFWGALVIFASMVPIVGAALVWLPASFYLLVTNHPTPALIIFLWGLIVGLVCDNILRPKILGAGRGIHPLLTFFSVLGGLYLFGMVGLFIGPLILAVLLSLLDVYQRSFLAGWEEKRSPGSADKKNIDYPS